jgi:hypothetical protein
MRRTLAVLGFLMVNAVSLIAAPQQRMLADIPAARESLLRIVSPKFYRSLIVSPIKGWIVARGQLSGARIYGARIAHSELNGEYDKLALDLANNLVVIGFPRVEMGEPMPSVLVHVLVYEIADARMALSFAHIDGPGGTQMRYYGAAWMAVQKPNHLWETIEPQRLAPHEQRGPRMYTLSVESPFARANLPRAVGHPLLRAK